MFAFRIVDLNNKTVVKNLYAPFQVQNVCKDSFILSRLYGRV